MAKERSKKSVGEGIVGALQEFAEAVEAGEDLHKRFARRTVRLNAHAKTDSPKLVKKTADKLHKPGRNRQH